PILFIGGAGPLRSPRDPELLVADDQDWVPGEFRAIARASVTQLRICEAHTAPWTYLSPPATLVPGRRTGRYRHGTTTLLVGPDGSSRISAEDLALAVVDELEDGGGPGRHMTVGY
ncbi:MAG: NAD(P)-dependent oxidoreductase, partial [Stackebrandtia sp.]